MSELEKYYNRMSEDLFGIGDFDMLKLAAYERRTDVLEKQVEALDRIAETLHSIDYTGLLIGGYQGKPISVDVTSLSEE